MLNSNSSSSSSSKRPIWQKLMWFLGILLVMFIVILMLRPVTRVKTPVGLETVVVDTPLFFGSGGVRPYTLKPGAKWIWRTTDRIQVDPKPYVIPKAIDDFVAADNILVDFESTVTVQVTNWPKMIALYGPDWWKNNLERPYIAMVRQQVKGHEMKALMSNIEAANTIDTKLTGLLTDKVRSLNMPVRIVEISLGRAKPNATILEQMNATATQQQRLLTLEQSRLAELKRADEQKAKADADNAYRNSIGLDVSEFVQLQLADKQIEACKAAKECVLLPPGTATVVAR